MTYETIDWDAEAKRLKKAFGLKGACYFEEWLDNEKVESGLGNTQSLRWEGNDDLYLVPEKVVLWCHYHREWGASYWFNRVVDNQSVSVRFDWDGKSHIYVEIPEIALIVAKSLYYLDLLTPEVEAKLAVTVSAPQKLEWRLADEARYER